MRMLRIAVLLALAGWAWKAIKPKLPAARAQIAKARERIEPRCAMQPARFDPLRRTPRKSVRDVSLTAAESAESVANAIRVGGDDAATRLE